MNQWAWFLLILHTIEFVLCAVCTHSNKLLNTIGIQNEWGQENTALL